MKGKCLCGRVSWKAEGMPNAVASLSLQHVPPLDGLDLCDPGMVQARCGDLASDYA